MEKEEPKIAFIQSKRNKTQLIIDNKYIKNFYIKDKKENQTFKCIFYKKENKCSSYIKLNKEKKIISYDSYHNHNISEKEAPQRKVKSEIKNKINKADNPFNIKPGNIYKEVTKNAGLIIPEFKTVKSVINRTIKKNFPKEIKEWDEIPIEHDYYYTISKEKFLVKKTNAFMLFQSPDLAKLHLKYKDTIFCDATFYTAPSLCY